MQKRTCHIILATLFFLAFAGSLGTFLFFPSILDDQIQKKSVENSVLTKDNYNMWGLIPGDLELNFSTTFYFYNFTNPDEVLYFNATPEFVEVGPFTYQQFQNLSNPVYETDETGKVSSVTYNLLQYWKQLPHTNDDLKVTTINIGALGAWQNMKGAEKAIIALQVLYNLFATLEKDMLFIGYCQGVYQQYKGNRSTIQAQIFDPAGLSPEMSDWVWNDPNLGWANWSSIRPWVEASFNGPHSDAYYLIKDYFIFDDETLDKLLFGNLNTMIKLSNTILTFKYNCSGEVCDGRYLTALQWTSQGVTNNPPGGGTPQESIMTGNTTGEGFPEISAYLTEVFHKHISNSSEYQNLTFTLEFAYSLFNHTKTPDGHNNMNQDTILHIGNLRDFWTVGEQFDKTKDLTKLESMKERFHFASIYHTHVFWEYLKYLVDFFVIKTDVNTHPGVAIMGVYTSRSLYNEFLKLQEYLLPHITAKLLEAKYTEAGINSCVAILTNSISAVDGTRAQAICNKVDWLQTFNSTSYKKLMRVCWYANDREWTYLLQNTDLTDINLIEFCDETKQQPFTFGKVIAESELFLRDYYNCSKLKAKCNKFEIALMQLTNSTITNGLPNQLKSYLPTTLTVTDWNSTEFSVPFEYLYFITRYRKLIEKYIPIEGMDYEKAKRLMNFDHLFSALMAAKAFNIYKNSSVGNFSQLFLFDKPEPLLYYLRYLMIEIGLGGFVSTRTVFEHLWGYEDDFLKTIRETNPLDGGDPSINSILQLAQNGSVADSLNSNFTIMTGADDINNLRKIKQISGETQIRANQSYFNGNVSTYKIFNPWKKDLPIVGEDTFQSKPGLKPTDNVTVYMPRLYRSLTLLSDGTSRTIQGMETNRYRIDFSTYQSSKTNPENDIYYHDKYDGVLNMSAPLKFPIHISKVHLLYADKHLQDSIKIFEDAEKTKQVLPDPQRDDDYFDIEPVTGAIFDARQGVQCNFELSGDELLATNFNGMFPLFHSISSAQLPTATVDKLYSQLKVVLEWKERIRPIAAFAAAAFLLLFLINLIYALGDRRDGKINRSTAVATDLIDNDTKINLLS